MAAIGATLGSGAVFVLDDSRDIVDVVTRIAGSLNMNPVENVPLAEKAPCALLS